MQTERGDSVETKGYTGIERECFSSKWEGKAVHNVMNSFVLQGIL